MLVKVLFISLILGSQAYAAPAETSKNQVNAAVQRELIIQPPMDEVSLEEPPVAQVAEEKLTQNEAAPKPALKLKETEIPVVLESQKRTNDGPSPLSRALLSVLVFAALGVGAYFFFKRYMKNAGKAGQAAQIKVLAQHYLGPKKSVAIIRVAGESMLVGITDHNISLLKQLSLLDEDIPEETPANFSKVFGLKNKSESAHAIQFEEGRDDFSISGIKDIVHSRLKNMRTIE